MSELQNQFTLSENEYILTMKREETYRLVHGDVFVYVVPMYRGAAAEPKLYCRISENERQRAIPSLVYKDEEGKSWHILIKPVRGEATISCSREMPTSILYKNFLKRGNLPGSDSFSFAQSMAAYYDNTIELAANNPDPYMSENSADAYRVVSGEVSAFIVPLENGFPGKPRHCCDIHALDAFPMIPSLLCMDQQQNLWFLMIKAKSESAFITRISGGGTEDIRSIFLDRIGMESSDSRSFEERMLAYYEQQGRVVLSGPDFYLSEDTADAYRVDKGAVFVFITPVKGGHPVNPWHYCEVRDSDPQNIIPGLKYESLDHTRWRLMIKPATEEAEITPLKGASSAQLQQDFLAKAAITTFEMEGFEKSLVDHYTKKVTLADSSFIDKSSRADSESKHDVKEILKDTFSDNGQTEHTSNAYYQALQFISKRMDMPLIKAEDMYTTCGKDADIKKIAEASHLICRKVVLDADWYKFDCGGLVGTIEKEIVACAPDKKGKYQLFRASDESVEPLTPELAQQISPQAYSLGRTLPLKPLARKDVFDFCKKSIRSRDLTPYIILVIFCALIGVLLPTLNGMIYDDYIPVGNIGNLTQLCLVMLTFMFGNLSFSIVKNLFGYRITSRVGIDLQNAVYHRLFHLPESYFRKYDSADLAGRISGIGSVASRYANTLVLSSISAVFSVFYLIRMFTYNTKLTWVSIAIYAVYLLIIVGITSTARKAQVRIAEAESESSGKLYQYLNGVDKIRMAGVEERAMVSFMQPYARQQYEEIKVNRLVSVEEALSTIVRYLFSMVLYWYIVKKLQMNDLSVGTFAAFNSAFGSFTAALGSLIDEALQILQEKNEIKRFWDVFDTVPEDDDSKEMPGAISGSLSLDHVSFSYEAGGKNILNDLSMDIQSGDYVGIVGPSGCGKSTLLKLLLGFESPQTGMVTVDKKDLRSLNKAAYRRQLGVVLQNGKLISGSIFENITITAPEADMKRVNEVVAQVGLKEDIQQMPMGLHTMLSENCNTISGGQQQRILIARAICGKPKILIFDEATSALDNMTQAAVSTSLDKMNVTRIVVAHRLSTIKNCDRIYVMNEGRIIQQGNYESLMKDTDGLFYQLASRQIAQ